MSASDHDRTAARPRILREAHFWMLLALAGALFGARLGALSIRGEEPRRARVAYEMLETGDFVVPRQQGQVYTSRPPLQNWTIAAAAQLLGGLSAAAVRLPAVLATVATVVLIYWYARGFVSPTAALAAGAAYATMLQVLELGRLAETEATLTLLIAASLLVWHRGYLHGWPAAATWTAGYALAALAGLAKGPQGPVYFVAVTGFYLVVVRRDWRMVFHGGHAVGVAALVAIVAAWWVPFWLATDSRAALAIWGQNAAIRYANPGFLPLAANAAAFPVRVLICTLPWSALLAAYCWPSVRRQLGDSRPYAIFLLTAVLVTLPSCLTAIEARARYFMPLYPCLALLIAPIAELALRRRDAACDETAAADGRNVAGWVVFHWQGALALVLVGIAGAMLVATAFHLGNTLLVQSAAASVAYAVAVALGALAVFWLRARAHPGAMAAGFITVAALVGLTYVGPRINELVRKSADNAAQIAALRRDLPAHVRLVSFGRAHHLFAYYYGQTIPALDWPTVAGAVPAEIDYFCFEDLAGFDEPDLPFAWETVAVVACDRNRSTQPEQKMIVGRRLSGGAATAERTTPEAMR